MDKTKEVLVLGGSPDIDWCAVFAGVTGVRVTAVPWDGVQLTAFSDGGGCCMATVSRRGSSAFRPDIALVRGALRGAHPTDHRNQLLALAFGGVPCVNSADSLLRCQDKPLVHAVLQAIRRRLGRERFPLIDQTFFPSWRSMTFLCDFPRVAKVSTVHAGLGKMRLASMTEFTDLRSILALTGHYCTTEPFVDWDYDWRLQKIGAHVRGFRRTSDSWKGASLASRDSDEPVTEEQSLWLDEVANALGMDILTIDGVHGKDGRDYILEINDSAIGLNARHQEEDLGHIRDLVLSKLAIADAVAADAGTAGMQQASASLPPSRTNDPVALALEQAQAEVRRLQARVAELEQQHQQSQQQKKGWFSR